MDAILGMEGNGPSAGEPRKIGYILASTNPLALDVVVSEMMGLQKRDNPVLQEAEHRNMHPHRIEDIQLHGVELSELIIPDFKLPQTIATGTGFGLIPYPFRMLLEKVAKHGAALVPKVKKQKCIACGVCRDGCPMHVITVNDDKYAEIDTRNCIRCYCCHEMCPEDAIELKGGLLYHILN